MTIPLTWGKQNIYKYMSSNRKLAITDQILRAMPSGLLVNYHVFCLKFELHDFVVVLYMYVHCWFVVAFVCT